MISAAVRFRPEIRQQEPSVQTRAESSSWLGRSITYIQETTTSLIDACRRLWAWFMSALFTPAQPVHRRQIRHALAAIASAPAFDPVMQQLQVFITNLSGMIGTSIYNKLLQPFLQTVSFDIQSLSKNTALWQAVTSSIAKAVTDELLNIIEAGAKESASDAKLALCWLVFGGGTDATKNSIKQSLATKFASDLKSSAGLLDRFVDWLFDTKRLSSSDPIPSLKSLGDDSVSKLLRSLLETSIQMLISQKLAAFLQYLAAQSNNIAALLNTAVQTNSTKIGKIVGLRLATLIQGASPLNPPPNRPTIYQQNYDQILDIIVKQIQAIITAYKTPPKNSLETNFSTNDVCDETVGLLLNPPAGPNAAIYRTGIEDKMLRQFAQTILSLLLPDDVEQNGDFTVTTPGVILLLRELDIPREISQAFQKLISISLPNALFPSGSLPTFDMIFSSIEYFIEKGFASILMDQMQTGLARALKTGMNYLISPSYLNMWMTKGLLPDFNLAISEAIMCIKLSNCDENTAELFLALYQTPSSTQALCSSLYEMVGKICQMPLSMAQVSLATFSQAVQPFIDQVITYLTQNPPKGRPTNTSDVKQALATLTQPVNVGANPDYGAIVKQLAVDIGGIRIMHSQAVTQGVCQLVLEKAVSRALTSALDPLRANEQLFVSCVIGGLSEVIGTESQVDQALFGPPVVVVDEKAALFQEDARLSILLDVLVHLAIDQLPANSDWFTGIFKDIGASGLKKSLPDQNGLKKALIAVYNTLLADRYINENLFVRMLKTTLDSLQTSALTT